ncbi:MAG: 5-(carboxyamino)imidazole ribonucleotide synthase [Cyclobacteriaceae bacterium]|nr:5-(carboxyamino)imidazole ribonucleotide synthase [Cyclobacteriaceae bacterium]
MGIQQQKLGVLGGGQLGRMLLQAGLDLNIQFSVLDPDAQAPCYSLASFTQGKLTDFDTVMAFGQGCDIITIEIENVNTRALRELEKMGKKVFPQPHLIELIQDKRTQKEFYRTHHIPTAEFVLVENRADVQQHGAFLPAVNKLGKEGYDGRGVQMLRTAADFDKAFDKPGLLERLIDFDQEIAVIAARNEKCEVATFPAVEMVFHPEHNLVEYLYSPASISLAIAQQADQVARRLVEQLQLVGLLAVEMFVTKDGQVLVNEVAPRPHNSGHHTIEANVTSQYEQHLRAIFNLPLGDTRIVQPSAMVNLLGEAGFEGPAKYEGLEAVMKESGVHVHLYGKKNTKPFRKMGHVTLTGQHVEELKTKVEFVKRTLKVVA